MIGNENVGEQQHIEVIHYQNARLELDRGLATFWLDNPARLNALNPGMIDALYAALIEVGKPRRRVRALMITGEGRALCAGADLTEGAAKAARKRAEPPVIESVSTVFHPLVRRLRDLEVPLIVAANGPCVGFGVAIALLADYVIAVDSAYFLIPFASLASGTDLGITWMLPRAIGTARARQLVMRAERLPADRALDWGMINQVVSQDEFRASANDIARGFANGPTIALGVIRRLFQNAFEQGLDAHLEEETRGVARTSRTKDNTVAIMSFGKKERPKFIGE